MANEIMDVIGTMAGVNAEQERDWIWATGDTRPHKETLKQLGFRWSRKRGSWYHKCGASETAKAKSEMIKPSNEEFAIKNIDGYMGGGGFVGSKAGLGFYEIPAAIRADLKRHNIKGVTIARPHHGSLVVTITPKISDFVSIEEYTETVTVFEMSKMHWISYQDDDGNWHEMTRDKFQYDISDEEREKIRVAWAKSEYNKHLTTNCSLNEHYIDEYTMYTEEFRKKLHYIRQIVLSYNSDESNTMVDYFDRRFYESYYIKPAKK